MRTLDEHMNALRACGRQNALFWAVYCQYLRARWSESVGVRLSDVPEDDQRGVSALNVAHAPMLRCCMRANQTAKGAIWRRLGSTAYRAPTGRRRLNKSCAGKRIKTCKKIEKMAGNEIETHKGTDPWQRVKSEGGRFAKVGVI